MSKNINRDSYKFVESAYMNSSTFMDYFYRMEKICTSMFEWVGIPTSMNQRAIEENLFYFGKCAFLKDKQYGFINTKTTGTGNINLYGLPISMNCYSYDYQSERLVYSGLPISEDKKSFIKYLNEARDSQCILVMNNYNMLPTASTIELFCKRLAEAEETAYVNIKAQKTPVLVVTNDSQRLTMKNVYMQYDGNQPVIFGDKDQLNSDSLRVMKTDAPFIADKVMEYKKQIWNEFLTFIGINNIDTEKKERLISDEASQNNELINMNLQSFLAPRKEACQKFNELFGTNIDVKVRSDLNNVIKELDSIYSDLNKELKQEKEGVQNG